MEIFATGGLVLLIGIGVVILVVLFLVMLLIARAWFKVARADEALVVSGRSQKDGAGKDSAVTVIVNGKASGQPDHAAPRNDFAAFAPGLDDR